MLNIAYKLLNTCILIFITTAVFANQTTPTSASTANRYYQEQNWSKAAQAYQEITNSQAQNHLAWYRLGIAHIELNEPSPALQALSKAANSPNLPRMLIFYQQARAYKLLNKHDEMFTSLQQAAESGYSIVTNFQQNAFWNDVKNMAQFVSITNLVDKNARPCLYDDKYAQFDFWLGKWDVYGNLEKTGPKYGHNLIEKSQNGCLLTEHWLGAGGSTGTSMNYYDGTINRWVQHWVSASGTVINYQGDIQDGAMILHGKIFYINTEQNPIRDFRGSWKPVNEGVVRQLLEESVDGGKTWYTWFDGFYFSDKSD